MRTAPARHRTPLRRYRSQTATVDLATRPPLRSPGARLAQRALPRAETSPHGTVPCTPRLAHHAPCVAHGISRIHARHGARRTTLDTHPPMPHALAVASLCHAHTSARPGICGNRSKTRLKSRSTTRSPTRSTTRHRRKPSAAPARRGRYPAITRVAVSRADRPASVRKTSPTHRTGCPSVLQDAFLAAQAASEPAPTHQSVRNLEMRATVQVETSSTPRCRDRTSPFARRPSRQFVRASATARFDRAAALSPAVVGAPALAYPLDKDGSPGLANCESRTVSREP
ncbi:hypothetical protein DM47_1652 [Burkholderia mallei]|nr:hypothetical protein DM46_1064 [Burkholderia mallei]KOS91781.1 hypothetical protein DM45_2220 [Burkholderia mallei]KOT08485.1 hypothetical protein DM77_1854 [Burkholderia mallei]KOT18319.1 hypothetical protein DM47_1652 [Burkholderia mallei]